MNNIKSRQANEVITHAFENYAAAVAQSRALVDVRDGLKPSARQILYSLWKNGYTSDKPFKSTLTIQGVPTEYYVHGDASLLGILMKSAQPFYMNHRLVEVSGNYGTLEKGDDYAAARYTSTRLSPITDILMSGINEDAIEDDEWVTAHDGEGKYPAVLPSRGYYNIVNGSLGIGVGIAASIPPFNLNEVNSAIVTLLKEPEAPFDDIYCPPDFPTGGTITNANFVKKTLKDGQGGSVKIQGKMHYEEQDNKIVVTEIPYGVYTESITLKIMDIIMEKEDSETKEPLYINPGIKNVKDFSAKEAKIYIYLQPGASVDVVMDYLYKNTALESYYAINMTMLKDGKYPQVFGWREALEEHIQHELKVYTRVFKHKLSKANARKHIVEGFIKFHSIMDDVIATIRKSSGTAAAKLAIQTEYGFSEAQSAAITRRTVGSLNNLDITKFNEELNALQTDIDHFNHILTDEKALRTTIAADYKDVAKKFGRPRRTDVKNIDTSQLRKIYFTVDGKCYRTQPKTAEVVATGFTNTSEYIAITEKGVAYRMYEIPSRAKKVFNIDSDDRIVDVFPAETGQYLCYLSKTDSYRATNIDTLNKFKTTLTIGPISHACLSEDKLKKDEFKKIYKD